ncbi:hypothetical protein HNY73_011373 [Argiope bruennichi]|uniref:Uncharacterized protein n=1 Tax=Argiope bruennichi TaxID=94029 RepID=A0A8T0F3W7_ARGBR|nr:hypothetical protein HNY73_011373 [Argiope bruennichi]
MWNAFKSRLRKVPRNITVALQFNSELLQAIIKRSMISDFRIFLIIVAALSKMSARYHLSAYDRGRAVGRLEAGQSVTTVADAMGVSECHLAIIEGR